MRRLLRDLALVRNFWNHKKIDDALIEKGKKIKSDKAKIQHAKEKGKGVTLSDSDKVTFNKQQKQLRLAGTKKESKN